MGAKIMTNKIYKSVNIWRKDDGGVKIYRCFEILGESKYCVQSCDFIDAYDKDKKLYELEKQALDLFINTPPDERTETYSSLEEAIRMHDKEFKEFE